MEKIELVREALKDFKEGKLSELSTLIAIDLTVNGSEPPTEDAINWGIKAIGA